jgi:hypothetical protein
LGEEVPAGQRGNRHSKKKRSLKLKHLNLSFPALPHAEIQLRPRLATNTDKGWQQVYRRFDGDSMSNRDYERDWHPRSVRIETSSQAVALLLNRGFCGQLAVFYHLNRGQTAGIGVPVVLERKLALRGNDLFYEGAATSTRLDFPSGPHFRHRGLA